MGYLAMEQKSLGRVREDMATMKAAMGGPVFGSADVRFLIALSITSGIFAVSHVLGAHSGWPLWLSRLPVILVGIAYMGYIGVKFRWNSKVNLTRRNEYHMAFLTLLPVVLVTLAARHWAARARISYLQFGDAIGVVVGFTIVMMGLTNMRPTRYPGSFNFATGLPTIVGCLLYPFYSRTQETVVVSCMGVVVFGLVTMAMQHHLHREAERTTDAAD